MSCQHAHRNHKLPDRAWIPVQLYFVRLFCWWTARACPCSTVDSCHRHPRCLRSCRTADAVRLRSDRDVADREDSPSRSSGRDVRSRVRQRWAAAAAGTARNWSQTHQQPSSDPVSLSFARACQHGTANAPGGYRGKALRR